MTESSRLIDDLAQLRQLVRALVNERTIGAAQVPRLVERAWVREVHAGADTWLELTEHGRDALAGAVEPSPASEAALTPQGWAHRFADRRALHSDLSTREELEDEGRRLHAVLGEDMTPEAAADAVSTQWGDL